MWWLLRYGGFVAVSFLGFCYLSSTLARRGVDDPCPSYPRLLRLMYGVFGTRFTHLVLGYFAHTRPGEAQAEQAGGTRAAEAGETATGCSLRVAVLPILGQIFGGNYAYVVYDAADTDRRAVVVDAADPEVVLRYLAGKGLRLTHVLTTHWHWDHSGGNRRIKAAWPDALVVGGAEEGWRVPCASHLISHGDTFHAGALHVRCHGLRGHTRGSMCYEVSLPGAEAKPALFTGDALFVGGCGALFEKSASLMYDDLGRLFGALPSDTLLFPGHEYTVMLLMQALQREPGNDHAKSKLARAREQRKARRPTVPSPLGDELAYNAWARAAVKRNDFGDFCLLCGIEAEPARGAPAGGDTRAKQE